MAKAKALPILLMLHHIKEERFRNRSSSCVEQKAGEIPVTGKREASCLRWADEGEVSMLH